MTEPPGNSTDSTDSSNYSNINIRRIGIYELPSIDSESSYSPISQYSNDTVSSLSEDSINSMPFAVHILDIENQYIEAQYIEEYNSEISDNSSYLSDNFYESKVFLYKYIILVIWLSYIIGLILLPQVNFGVMSPNNNNLIFQTMSEYPQCSDMRGDIWRFFTTSIVHGNVQHIFFNTLVLFLLLYFMETLQGYKSLIYILSLSSIYTGLILNYFSPYIKAVGCSHLVFATSGALIADYFINRKNRNNTIVIYTRNLSLLASILVILFEVCSFFFLYQKDIAYIGHWAGWISGFFLGLIGLKDTTTKKSNKVALIIGTNAMTLITTYFLYYYIADWPSNTKNILDSTGLPFCCYEMIVNNVTDVPCYK